jgi:3',5'-cyclic AMP phosphodiesterase CpdA
MAIFLTILPYKGLELPVIDAARDDSRMVIEMIADTHLEDKEFLRQTFVKAGLRNLSRASTPIDAVVVAGDLTNYADEPSLAKYYEILDKYSPAPVISCAGNHDIGHAGDRDVTDITREEAKANYIRYNNEYLGINAEDNYYTYEVNGYKFIVIGDICYDGGHWDDLDLGDEQLAFLDSELAAATAEGKPAFVVCHWPVDGMNGQEIIWPGSGIDLSKNDVKSVMEKYDNVFYISGHMHAGIKSNAVDEKYHISCVETQNGVTYISLPTYGLVNSFGDPVFGTGMQLEVYDDEVIIRPRNFITNAWYTNSVYTIDLVK